MRSFISVCILSMLQNCGKNWARIQQLNALVSLCVILVAKYVYLCYIIFTTVRRGSLLLRRYIDCDCCIFRQLIAQYYYYYCYYYSFFQSLIYMKSLSSQKTHINQHRPWCMTGYVWPAPEADLGMFSMFGRTGAPQKGGPTRGPANFCYYEIFSKCRIS